MHFNRWLTKMEITIFQFLTIILIKTCQIAGEIKVVSRPLSLQENIYFEVIEPEEISYTFKVRPAKDFGPDLNTTWVGIDLTPAEPIHACSPLTNTDDVTGTITLIERGGCSFLSKTIQAERAGALAAIIMDNDRSNDQHMIDMIQDETDRATDIPSFFLLGKDGDMIMKTLAKLNLHSASINIPINVTGNPAHQPPWTLL